MNALSLPMAASLALLVSLSLPSFAQEQSLDELIHVDYLKIEKAQVAMNGDMEDELRQKMMDEYRTAVDSFLSRWEGRATELDKGLFDLGRAAIQGFAPERAQGYFERFLSHNRESVEAPEATMFLGDAYRATEQNDKAVAIYSAFLVANPDHKFAPHAMLGMATARFLSLDFSGAIEIYRQLIAKFPDAEIVADAQMQLLNALVYGDRPNEAREHLAKLLEIEPEAPELQQRLAQVELLGRPAPALEGILDWSGVPGSNFERMRGRVIVLCFFRTKHIPCARNLQTLSSIEKEMRTLGVTVWGITKAYKLGKNEWKLDDEMRWLGRYRENPARVIQREVGYKPGDDPEEVEVWEPLESPITATLGLAKDFNNHKNFQIRRVPTVVVIDKQGQVRLIEEGGQAKGGFQERMLRNFITKLATEK